MNMTMANAEKTPTDGRYILCSNITLLSRYDAGFDQEIYKEPDNAEGDEPRMGGRVSVTKQ